VENEVSSLDFLSFESDDIGLHQAGPHPATEGLFNPQFRPHFFGGGLRGAQFFNFALQNLTAATYDAVSNKMLPVIGSLITKLLV